MFASILTSWRAHRVTQPIVIRYAGPAARSSCEVSISGHQGAAPSRAVGIKSPLNPRAPESHDHMIVRLVG